MRLLSDRPIIWKPILSRPKSPIWSSDLSPSGGSLRVDTIYQFCARTTQTYSSKWMLCFDRPFCWPQKVTSGQAQRALSETERGTNTKDINRSLFTSFHSCLGRPDKQASQCSCLLNMSLSDREQYINKYKWTSRLRTFGKRLGEKLEIWLAWPAGREKLVNFFHFVLSIGSRANILSLALGSGNILAQILGPNLSNINSIYSLAASQQRKPPDSISSLSPFSAE